MVRHAGQMRKCLEKWLMVDGSDKFIQLMDPATWKDTKWWSMVFTVVEVLLL